MTRNEWIEYAQDNALTKQDIKKLKELKIDYWEMGGDDETGLMYTTDGEHEHEYQLTYNKITGEIRAYADWQLVATDEELMGYEDFEDEAIDGCFDYYYERFTDITGLS